MINKEDAVKKLRSLFPNSDKRLFRQALKQRNKIIKVYNGFCDECRAKAFEDSTRPFDDYCEVCQVMAKRILE